MKSVSELCLSVERCISSVPVFKLADRKTAILISARAANKRLCMKKKLKSTSEAVYVRKSTNRRPIGDQMKTIRKFVKRQGLKIVKMYSDGGN